MLDGADVADGDVILFYTCGNELLPVACGQVDVPLVPTLTDGRHVEPCLGKGIVNLIAYLETVETNAWANLSNGIRRMCAIDLRHLMDGFFYDTLHGAPPSSMNGTGGMMRRVVEQYGDTVGRRDTYAAFRNIGH